MIQYIQDISIIFISIILEAFPFIMLGVIISAIIQEYVSDDFIPKVMPKNPILGALVGVVMGCLIPVCDCAVIPVARRLIKKGIPLNVGVTFMLASPIINPIVIIATIYSFGATIPSMVIYRSLLGMAIAIVIGLIISMTTKKNEIFLNEKVTFRKKHIHTHSCSCECGQVDNNELSQTNKNRIGNRLIRIIEHSKDEFFEITKYLIIGCLIASCAQVLIPREVLISINGNGIIPVVILMLFAYLISLCSTSDSFVAKTFTSHFSNNSILAFLLLGPMIDIKNTIVLLGNYNKKFVIKLISLIFIFIFIVSLIVSI
ncbi:MAG: permease [Clostridia bacterium]|nr:permease [Clostridia bacterium]MDD4387078.1 permease [Clostridia bacterium]